MSRKKTVCRSSLGSSKPTRALPGMGATMRTFWAASAIAKSSDRPAIFEILVPLCGSNSYIVTTGPG